MMRLLGMVKGLGSGVFGWLFGSFSGSEDLNDNCIHGGSFNSEELGDEGYEDIGWARIVRSVGSEDWVGVIPSLSWVLPHPSIESGVGVAVGDLVEVRRSKVGAKMKCYGQFVDVGEMGDVSSGKLEVVDFVRAVYNPSPDAYIKSFCCGGPFGRTILPMRCLPPWVVGVDSKSWVSLCKVGIHHSYGEGFEYAWDGASLFGDLGEEGGLGVPVYVDFEDEEGWTLGDFVVSFFMWVLG